ncbi:MAG: hypothetical protein FWB92_02765 [Oscillospiraceae bacterium]|nr:hypothetical protein [Oscillospiraceae bacterium]
MKQSARNDFAYIDRLYGLPCVSIISDLIDNFDDQKGFLYEHNAHQPKYFANVNATVALNLFFCDIIDNSKKNVIAQTIVNLKNNDYNNGRYTENNVWDAAEGENVFSTALSCYALMCLTPSKYASHIETGINWVLDSRKPSLLWSLYGDVYDENAQISQYVMLMLRKAFKMGFLPKSRWSKICAEIYGKSLFLLGNEQDLASLISLLSLCQIAKDNYSVSSELRNRVNGIILKKEDWYISYLNTAQLTADGKKKSMYTYNPVYLISLIQMGWSPLHECVIKMKELIVEDIRKHWNKFPPYIWRTHSGEVQSFIVSMSLYALHYWVKKTKNILLEEHEKNTSEGGLKVMSANKPSREASENIKDISKISISVEGKSTPQFNLAFDNAKVEASQRNVFNMQEKMCKSFLV